MIKKFTGVNEKLIYIDTELVKGVIIDPAHLDNPQLVLILTTGHSLQLCWAIHAEDIIQQFEAAMRVESYHVELRKDFNSTEL